MTVTCCELKKRQKLALLLATIMTAYLSVRSATANDYNAPNMPTAHRGPYFAPGSVNGEAPGTYAPSTQLTPTSPYGNNYPGVDQSAPGSPRIVGSPSTYSAPPSMAPNAGPPQGYSPSSPGYSIKPMESTLKLQRWTEEWKQQHPGQPVPNAGLIEKMHSAEIKQQIQQSGREMWAKRQADIRADYQAARHRQELQNQANHVTWTAGQWAQWNDSYQAARKAEAAAYMNGSGMSGEMARKEARRQMGWEP